METTQDTRPALRARSLTPDVARGLMLALIAAANVGIYLYGREYGFRQKVIETSLIDRIVTTAVTIFVDGRAYPLFAVLFGFGIALSFRRHLAKGTSEEKARSAGKRRCLWLAVFGAVHALFLFPGDVLGTYALLGLVIIGLVNAPVRKLVKWGGAFAAVATLLAAGAFGDPGPNDDRSHFWSFEFTSFWSTIPVRAVEWLMNPLGMAGVFAAGLVGVWLARHDILFRPENHRPLLRRVAMIGIGIGVVGGLPAGALSAGLWDGGGFGPLVSAVHTLSGIAAGAGYLALISWCIASIRQPGPLTRSLAALGERSLSGYLAQSVVFVALFLPFTLGWGETISTSGAMVVAIGTWGLTWWLAVVWAKRGWQGPAELAMRRLINTATTSRVPVQK